MELKTPHSDNPNKIMEAKEHFVNRTGNEERIEEDSFTSSSSINDKEKSFWYIFFISCNASRHLFIINFISIVGYCSTISIVSILFQQIHFDFNILLGARGINTTICNNKPRV